MINAFVSRMNGIVISSLRPIDIWHESKLKQKFQQFSFLLILRLHSRQNQVFPVLNRDPSTIQVGQEQIRQLFGEYALKDIFYQFISKMDTGGQQSEREKK